MEIAIMIITAAAIAAISIFVAIKLASKRILSAALAYPHTPAPVPAVEKGADGLYPEPPAGPEMFYGTLDDQARAIIDRNRTELDRARRIWAETHQPEKTFITAEDGCKLAGFIYLSPPPTVGRSAYTATAAATTRWKLSPCTTACMDSMRSPSI